MAINKRLIFWLVKAYIKKSGKTFLLFFILGLLLFTGFVFASQYYTQIFPFTNKQTIGMVGAYTQETLPTEIVRKISSGLTSLQEDGMVKPQLAESWEIQDSGKTYIFKLKKNQYFYNGKEITSDTINHNFSDVKTERPDKYTIIYRLNDAYSPFLVTATRPIFEGGNSGIGEYRIEKVERNGNFIQSLTIASIKNRQDMLTYSFYPTEEALKLAYLMGEVSVARGIKDITYSKHTFDTFPNTAIDKRADFTKLVTLFYNTSDSLISDKKLRLALSYALPDTFQDGIRSYLPYAPKSVYYNETLENRNLDYTHAKLLLLSSEGASESGELKQKEVTIKTLPKYKRAAHSIAESWQNIGVNTKIEEVDSVPNEYQIFLGDFTIPKDPDQYTLWHSNQKNNITRYKNLRIDKLLEDGRKTVDLIERKRLYDDFQKYLIEDTPASFLYFPTDYTITRK